MNGWKKCNKKSLLKIWCIKIAKHNAFPVGLFSWQGSFLPNLRTTAKEMFFPHCPILKLITTRIWDLIIVKISLYCDNQRVFYISSSYRIEKSPALYTNLRFMVDLSELAVRRTLNSVIYPSKSASPRHTLSGIYRILADLEQFISWRTANQE